MVCESCRNRANWRNGDGSFACSRHKDGMTAVFLGENRRVRFAKWAKHLADEGTVRLKEGTYLHNALVNAFNGKHRFTDLRDNDQNAGGLQKALILGLIEQDKNRFRFSIKNEYFLTDLGREAVYQLAQVPSHVFVKVAYKKNKTWADHAQNFIW